MLVDNIVYSIRGKYAYSLCIQIKLVIYCATVIEQALKNAGTVSKQ